MKRWLAVNVLLVCWLAGCDWQPAVTPPTAPPTVVPDEIARLVADVLGMSTPAPATTTLAELGADGLDLLDLVDGLQRTYGVSIPEQDLTDPGESGRENWMRLTIEDLAGIVSHRLVNDPGTAPPWRPDVASLAAQEPDDGPVGLQMWWVEVNANFSERIGVDFDFNVGSAPSREVDVNADSNERIGGDAVEFRIPHTPGSHAVFNAEQARWFRLATQGDRRSSMLRLPVLTLDSGRACDVPSGSTTSTESTGIAVQAKRIGAGACEIGLKWAVAQVGPKEPAPMVAAVPAGSTLVVNTRERRVGYAAPTVSLWDRLWHWNAPAPTGVIENRQLFLLIRPRLTPQAA